MLLRLFLFLKHAIGNIYMGAGKIILIGHRIFGLIGGLSAFIGFSQSFLAHSAKLFRGRIWIGLISGGFSRARGFLTISSRFLGITPIFGILQNLININTTFIFFGLSHKISLEQFKLRGKKIIVQFAMLPIPLMLSPINPGVSTQVEVPSTRSTILTFERINFMLRGESVEGRVVLIFDEGKTLAHPSAKLTYTPIGGTPRVISLAEFLQDNENWCDSILDTLEETP